MYNNDDYYHYCCHWRLYKKSIPCNFFWLKYRRFLSWHDQNFQKNQSKDFLNTSKHCPKSRWFNNLWSLQMLFQRQQVKCYMQGMKWTVSTFESQVWERSRDQDQCLHKSTGVRLTHNAWELQVTAGIVQYIMWPSLLYILHHNSHFWNLWFLKSPNVVNAR